MYARLWWKDLRQFWPIWVFLLLTSLATQALTLRYAGSDARTGLLPPLALSFAWLYAVAVGAAAFAGERENGTLRLLDILPVDRSLLWRSKAAFALVTTLALAAVVVIPAALSTDRWQPYEGRALPAPETFTWLPVAYFVLLVEALGWGLLVSSLSRTALTAALGAACCGAASLGMILLDIDTTHHAELLVKSIPLRLLAIAATAACSALAMIRDGRGGTQIAGRAASRAWSGGMRSAGRAWGVLRSPIVIRSPFAREANAAVATPPRGLWARWPEVRAVMWLTCHQGWRLWRLILAVVIVPPVLWFLFIASNDATGMTADVFFFNVAIGALAIAAGIRVFGAENQGRTHRFLAHHGARPGLVWGAKLLVWFFVVSGFWFLTLPFTLALLGGPTRSYTDPRQVLAMLGLWAYPFSVALFCGMVVRRGITAWVTSLILLMAVVIPPSALLSRDLISPYAMLAPPLALLFLTWAWRRDWMLDRPAPGRWIRLGTWAAGTLVVLFGGHVANRVWGAPDMPALPAPMAWRAAAIPDDRNAAKQYEEIYQDRFSPSLMLNIRDLAETWNHEQPNDSWFFKESSEVYGLVRKATALPGCRFAPLPQHLTELRWRISPPMKVYSQVLAIHAGDLGRKGDLAGAWGDIEALFRMAQQLTQDAVVWQAAMGLEIEEGALGLAMQWAADDRQTPERLHAALDAYRDLPAMTPAADVVRGMARIVEQTLDQPRNALREQLIQTVSGPKGPSTWDAFEADASTTPWEIERARRINRYRFARLDNEVSRDPSGRSRDALNLFAPIPDSSLQEARMLHQQSPNVWFFLDRNDRNEVGRRALLQILALRIWQLEHGGKLPESLDALIPGLLPKLPNDPYGRNQPFRYTRSDGRRLPSLGSTLTASSLTSMTNFIPTTEGYRLLYSVGINMHDNGGTFQANLPNSSENDIIFPLKDDVRIEAGDAAKKPGG